MVGLRPGKAGACGVENACHPTCTPTPPRGSCSAGGGETHPGAEEACGAGPGTAWH